MDLNYYSFGKRGKLIVFLHGWQQSGQSFFPLVFFLYRRYRLYLLDLPGFGKSRLPKGTLNSFDYARITVLWIKKRRLKSIILVGHSFGGKIAAIIAAQHPDLVEKLVLIDSAGVYQPDPIRRLIYWFRFLVPKTLQRLLLPIFINFFASYDYRQAGRLLPIFKNVVREDIRTIFGQINQPTLIIWGKEDKETPLRQGWEISRLIKKNQFFVLTGGHFPFCSQPKKIAQLIDKFIQHEDF